MAANFGGPRLLGCGMGAHETYACYLAYLMVTVSTGLIPMGIKVRTAAICAN